MFLESKGAPMAAAKVGAAPPPTNGLVANAKEATDELWKARNYLNIKPAQRKDTLGYALDREEALGYLVTSALHLPLLSPEEALTIGKVRGGPQASDPAPSGLSPPPFRPSPRPLSAPYPPLPFFHDPFRKTLAAVWPFFLDGFRNVSLELWRRPSTVSESAIRARHAARQVVAPSSHLKCSAAASPLGLVDRTTSLGPKDEDCKSGQGVPHQQPGPRTHRMALTTSGDVDGVRPRSLHSARAKYGGLKPPM